MRCSPHLPTNFRIRSNYSVVDRCRRLERNRLKIQRRHAVQGDREESQMGKGFSQRKRGGGTIAFQNETLWKSLSKTNLILAPPGHSRTEAHKIIEATHQE